MQLQIDASERALADPASRETGDDSRASLVLRLHTHMEPLAERWRAMEAGASISLHQSYDWCLAWTQAHACDLLIIEGVSAGRSRFILPLEIVRRGPLRVARLLATDFSNINTGLHTDEFRAAGGGALLPAALEQARGELARSFDLLLLEKMPLDWRGERNPFADLPAVLNQNAAFQLTLFEDFEKTLAQLNAKRRRKRARSSERRLLETGGYEHVVAASPEEALALLDTFFSQKAARFKAMGLPDVFRAEETRAFFRRLAVMEASDTFYPLRLHALRLSGAHAGHIAAVTGLSRKGDHVICQFGSIDDSVAADASPGDFLFHLVIERLCAEGAHLFDFGIGDQPYKRSWCRIETAQHDLLWPATTAGRIASGAHRTKTAAKRFIKRNPRLYWLLQRLRFGRTDADSEGA
jgi:CelD/BcsL family acetyltransferase involved in cellulose biosynthesis